jgi:hypothetical protein
MLWGAKKPVQTWEKHLPLFRVLSFLALKFRQLVIQGANKNTSVY